MIVSQVSSGSRARLLYDDIIDAACEAWNKLTALPDVITSIGPRDWAHIGQRRGTLV